MASITFQTKEEIAQITMRAQRNQLLAQTDWWVLPDRTPTQAQIEYRQALRDITTQTPSLDENGNLTGIIWPTAPTD